VAVLFMNVQLDIVLPEVLKWAIAPPSLDELFSKMQFVKENV
jgi:hypothetical protein